MPSSSAKQHCFMMRAASSSEFAKKVGIAVSVAKEFVQADEHKKKLVHAMRSKKK